MPGCDRVVELLAAAPEGKLAKALVMESPYMNYDSTFIFG
jgi:hypothetical protein